MAGSEIRDRIETVFERWGRFVVRRRWHTIGVVLAFSAALITQVPKIEIDTSIEGFLLEDDPTLLVYNDFRDEFDRDDRLMIGIRPPEVFSFEFLEKLRSFHEDLERDVPYLDDVDSLINARETRGGADELIVEDLFERWPEDETALAEIEARALANPLYPNLLLSEDGRFTTLSLKLATYSSEGEESALFGFEDAEIEPEGDAGPRSYMTGEEGIAAMAAVREVVRRYAAPDFEIYLAGPPVVNERMAHDMTADMQRFLALSLLTTAVFLFILFRRVSGSLIPVVVVLLSLLTTVGLAPWLGIALQLPTQILPAFLMAVGVGDSVHILAIFYQQLRAGTAKEDAIPLALGHSGLAVLMASLTTAGALISFSAAELLPIRNLGIVAPIGVLIALVYTLTLLPALLAVVPLRGRHARGAGRLALFDGVLARCASVSTRHPIRIVAVSAVVLVVAGFGAAQLRFSHNPLTWFPEGDEIRVAFDTFNEELKGTTVVEVLFDTGVENGMHEPDVLERLEDLQDYNKGFRDGEIVIGKSVSMVDILKEIHQALNENRPDYYALPEERKLIAQEFLLFENSGSDDLEDVTDSLFRVGRMTLRTPWVDAISYPPFMRRLEAYYQETMGEDVHVTITGLLPLLSRTFEAVIHTMARSYVIAFVVITALMILLLGSFRAGLISMIPNLTPILMTLAVMGWFGFPLDGFTLLIGSVALGLAVDDTIHFMHNFRRYYDRTGDAAEAVRLTLATTGQAMFVTTLVLCAGFFVFMLGRMNSTVNFGFLTGFALALAFVADVLLAPALMVLVTRWREAHP